MKTIGIIGARGYVGGELVKLIAGHQQLKLVFAGSRALSGQQIGAVVAESLSADQVAERDVDVIVMALPNGKAKPYVQALDAAVHDALLIDLGADYRFDPDWHYGLPELYGAPPEACRRISNPGCYATAMQLVLHPLKELLAAPAVCFGVSGFSGAGTAPSANNDPERLKDNLLPYAPTGHVHEREVSHRLGCPIHFVPHVAAFFRGLSITCDACLSESLSVQQLGDIFQAAYLQQPLVQYQERAPGPRDAAGGNGAIVGGVASDGNRVVAYCVLDNLLKGAAVQALQNINLAMGFDEYQGIEHA